MFLSNCFDNPSKILPAKPGFVLSRVLHAPLQRSDLDTNFSLHAGVPEWIASRMFPEFLQNVRAAAYNFCCSSLCLQGKRERKHTPGQVGVLELHPFLTHTFVPL